MGTGSQADTVKFHNFADIGHSLWIFVVAILGGAVAGLLGSEE